MPHVKEFRIPKSRKFLLLESEILAFGIWKTAQGIRNPTDVWNSESTFHQQRPWNIWNPNSRWGIIQDPRLPWIPLHGAITCVKCHIVDRSVLPWRNAALVTQKTQKKNIAEQTSAIRQGCLFFFQFSFRGFLRIYDGTCKQNCNTKKKVLPIDGCTNYRCGIYQKALIPILWCNRNWKNWETKNVGRMKKKDNFFPVILQILKQNRHPVKERNTKERSVTSQEIVLRGFLGKQPWNVCLESTQERPFIFISILLFLCYHLRHSGSIRKETGLFSTSKEKI